MSADEFYTLLNLQIAFSNEPFTVDYAEVAREDKEYIRATIKLCDRDVAEIWARKELPEILSRRVRLWIFKEIDYAKRRDYIIRCYEEGF